ncbi:MAG: FecCD family ABC transporter permease [Acutalibacteraceae bacterium]
MENKTVKKQNTHLIFGILTGLLLLVTVLSLFLGSTKINPVNVILGLLGKAENSTNVIIQNLRLPRTLAGILAGVGLSVSGVLLQSVTDNELASPNIIGVNSGAGFMVILMLAVLPVSAFVLPFGAFLGAFGATVLIIFTSSKIGSRKSTVILSGVALTTILNALISFITLLDTDVISTYNYFSIGGLSGVSLKNLYVPAVFIGLSLAVSVVFSGKISILCLGDSLAASLGLNVKRLRIICLVCASLSAASVVSFAGLLGFVGLVVPHISRKLVGSNTKNLLICASLAGAVIVTFADTLGRTLLAPTEIPVGIIMALVGSPYFLYILLKHKENGYA